MNTHDTLDATHDLRLVPGRTYSYDLRMDWHGDTHVILYGGQLVSNIVIEDMPVPALAPPKTIPTGCEGAVRNVLAIVSEAKYRLYVT